MEGRNLEEICVVMRRKSEEKLIYYCFKNNKLKILSNVEYIQQSIFEANSLRPALSALDQMPEPWKFLHNLEIKRDL